MRSLILAAAAIALQPASDAAPANDRIYVEVGYVANAGGTEGDGWIQFARSRQRFRLPAAGGAPYAELVAASLNRNVAVRVRYDARAGRPSASGGYIEYPLCSMSIAGGASIGDEAANCPAAAPAAAADAEHDLALGVAMVPTRPAEARELLGRALDTGQLRGRLRAMALEARGDAARAIAERLPVASESYDRALADALADQRAWVVAEPDDPRAQYAVAHTLADLGGYDEAIDIHRAIGRRWPQESYNVAVNIGAVHRQQGQYAEALRVLDDYVARFGPQDGMRFHYHRAWTLNLLGRPREAIDEIAAGLETQADYPYAFFMRACSHAKLGRLREALTDQERGLTLLRAAASDNPDAFADILPSAEAGARDLRGLIAARRGGSSDAPCTRLWERNIRSRPRSALLGPPRG